MEEFLRMVRNRGGGMDGNGEDVKVNLQLSFREAVHGCSKTVSFQTSTRCDACRGSGMPPGVKPQVCKVCNGSGMTISRQPGFMFQSTCMHCGGSGEVVKEKCGKCNGTGSVKTKKTVTVDVPPGVDTGNTIRVSGEGGWSSQSSQAGDVYVNLKVSEDPVFRREGANIHVDANISFTMAILGGKVQVPTLTGDVVLKVRQGTQHGHKDVLRGKGIKMLNTSLYGDQYIHFHVTIPTSLTQRQRALIEEYVKEEIKESGEENATAAGGRL